MVYPWVEAQYERVVRAAAEREGQARIRVQPCQPGHDTAYKVEFISGSMVPANFDSSMVDAVEVLSDEESFATARRLITEEGLGSSGKVVAGALRIAACGTEEPVVALLADPAERYLSQLRFAALHRSDNHAIQ